MRALKLGLAAIAATFAFSAAASADCIRVGSVGDGLTKDIAVIMSTHGLANIIEAKGRKGHGPVHTTCSPGTFGTECHSSQTACK
jgi:hypothetical protein